jgi:hypothetical protein
MDRFAPPPPTAPLLSNEDAALRHKFRGVKGGELVVDAITEKIGVNIFDDRGGLLFSQASVSLFNQSIYSRSWREGFPKTLRVEWRDRYWTAQDPPVSRPPGTHPDAYYGGTILGDYTVPIASRIPEDLLDELRKKGGSFRLKIRIHDNGPLIGWDIKDVLPTYHAGGDFREADIENGKVLRKGWYIHPKTGQKIETDF